jgi:hypothetical protein
MLQRCSEPQPPDIRLSHTLDIAVPRHALSSSEFCFIAALTEQHELAAVQHARDAYAVSNQCCIQLLSLINLDRISVESQLLPASSSPLPPPLSPASSTAVPQALLIARTFPLSPSLRRVCYFSHYDVDGNIAPHTLYLLEQIALLGFHVVFVTCSPWLTPLARRQLEARDIS